MARRVATNHPWTDEPGRLLGHDDPLDIWGKLNWEAGQFHAARRAEPPLDIDGIVYLLQNACISAAALVEWHKIAVVRSAREQNRKFNEQAFRKAVEDWLPKLPLARAIANTFKHGTYRDEGWGDAELRLEVLFTASQHERLRAAQDSADFEAVYAEEAAEADFRVTFVRGDASDSIDATAFVESLDHGGLRLLDAGNDGFEDYFEPNSP